QAKSGGARLLQANLRSGLRLSGCSPARRSFLPPILTDPVPNRDLPLRPEPPRSDREEGIPRKSIYRLSIYHRCLQRLKENKVETVSSEALASAARVKPTQLRKGLAYFGQFGTRGLG